MQVKSLTVRLDDCQAGPDFHATDVDPAWTPLIVTPAHPEYPSAHSIISSAATTVLPGNAISVGNPNRVVSNAAQ